MNAYEVTLKHSKNPDIPGGYWGDIPAEGSSKVTVATIQEASKPCMEYIKRNSLGGGNWTGGKVYQGKKQVARVSYNGRVWAMDGSEIK